MPSPELDVTTQAHPAPAAGPITPPIGAHPRPALRWLTIAAFAALLPLGLLLLQAPLPSGSSSSASGFVLLPTAGQPLVLAVGEDAPNFTLQSLEGGELSLEAYRGHVVVVNFWATWCPPCRSEMPDIQQVFTERKDKGLAILAVNIQEAPGPVHDFVGKYGLTFPIALDTSGAVTQLYRIYGLPMTYVVDAGGRVADVHVGPLTKSEILKKVDAAFASSAG